jgi:hypothetical protein
MVFDDGGDAIVVSKDLRGGTITDLGPLGLDEGSEAIAGAVGIQP